MSIAIALLSAMMIMILLLLHVTFYIGLTYQRQGDDDSLTVTIYCWRKLLFYQLEIPSISLSDQGRSWDEQNNETELDETESTEAEFQAAWRWLKEVIGKPGLVMVLIRTLRKYIRYSRHLTRLLRTAVCCEKFYWNTRFGTSDASVTGVVSGLLWSMKASIICRLAKQIRFISQPVIRVCPDFEDTKFITKFECIFSLRLGNVINAFFFIEKSINKGVAARG